MMGTGSAIYTLLMEESVVRSVMSRLTHLWRDVFIPTSRQAIVTTVVIVHVMHALWSIQKRTANILVSVAKPVSTTQKPTSWSKTSNEIQWITNHFVASSNKTLSRNKQSSRKLVHISTRSCFIEPLHIKHLKKKRCCINGKIFSYLILCFTRRDIYYSSYFFM